MNPRALKAFFSVLCVSRKSLNLLLEFKFEQKTRFLPSLGRRRGTSIRASNRETSREHFGSP